MAINDQYIDPPFGLSEAIAQTGAPGSGGATDAGTAPDNAYSSQLTMPYQSVQNQPVPRVGVGADDTALPGQNMEGISGLGPSDIASTGAGMGHTMARHPGSEARPA
jgi:hypothetical protein